MNLTDVLVVANGPEDGAEFPILRAPFHIGRSHSCEVPIRLDSTVGEVHVLVTAVPDGYRVRRLEAAPVWVDGKRVGMFRSRIARSGSILRVGHTGLVFECAPEGLAARSRGIASDSDLGWFLSQAARVGGKGLLNVARMFLALCGRVFGSSLAIVAIAVLLYFFVPPIHNWVNWSVEYLIYHLRSLIP